MKSKEEEIDLLIYWITDSQRGFKEVRENVCQLLDAQSFLIKHIN